MTYLVGIDLGSTSLKATIHDADGNLAASASRPTERRHPDPDHPDWTVWDPDQIWNGTAEALREAVSRLEDPGRIRGVAVTGMGMDGVPVDEHGQWLYPFISWLDPRTEPQQRWWLDTIGAWKQFSIGGNQLWPVTSALRILWFRENEPELFARTRRWVLIEDFLNLKLCGVLATDYSMASNTLLLDQRGRRWSEELLTASGLDREILCDPHPSGTRLGEVTAEAAAATGLPAGTPVVLGGHDYLMSTLPTGAFRPGVVLDVTGTWEIVTASMDEPVLTREVLDMGIIIESHVARDRFSAMCASVAADTLEWYRRELGSRGAATAAATGDEPSLDWPEVIEEARSSPPGARGVHFLPHLSGSTAPVVDPHSMGAFVGIRASVARADLVRAMFEGLDYQFRDILEALQRGLGIRVDRVAAVGGAVQNEFWMQNKADVLGLPIEAPAIQEATALGASIVAGIGVGVYADEEEAYARVSRPGRVFEPDPSLRDRYDEGFEVYRQLYPALAEPHRSIFRREVET